MTDFQGMRRQMRATLVLVLCAGVCAGTAAPAAAQSQRAVTPVSATQTKALPTLKMSFGDRLAAAALERTKHHVVYDPRYIKLKYPMGDVPANIGVCTDVIIRAYRTLGIDLQVLVHRARVGSGDKNIDHRRVRVLRKFFARYGRKLPISKDPKDYRPGDLVTYRLSQSLASNSHIAIVSSKKTADGRPLIVHNIGLGPKLEDWLFGDKITGHYRYTGPRR